MSPTIHPEEEIDEDQISSSSSDQSHTSAPPAPPHQHRRNSLRHKATRMAKDTDRLSSRSDSTFGGVSKRMAYREIRRAQKNSIIHRRGWDAGLYSKSSSRSLAIGGSGGAAAGGGDEEGQDYNIGEMAHLIKNNGGATCYGERTSGDTPAYYNLESMRSAKIMETDINDDNDKDDDKPWEALKEMFLENKINVLLGFVPFAYLSHAFHWSDGMVFILNFLAMVPLASMLGVFTEELAAHTNDVVGGLINATFGNAVELVVAIQALLRNDIRVVQASLIGSILSNLLLVLGMCFFCGGLKYSEQTFVSQGAVASIALLGLSGLSMLLPGFFGNKEEVSREMDELVISRVGAMLLILMYAQLLFFQLKTHSHLFDGGDDTVALIPFHWALIGLLTITAIVTILSEWLVGSIDGFCLEFHLGKSFVGVIVLPVVGNAVEHISAVTVAMKNKIDLALGVALGSAVQIGVFVLPVTVVIGWCTGRNMSLKFPAFEVYLYLVSVIIVSLCLSNQRSNWLEGSLLVCTYLFIAIGIYFEKDAPHHLE